ncbi:MAG: prepilin-type N-terminal cleavage/methylation domain-containing protein [Deltaproteobacteria bacterium]
MLIRLREMMKREKGQKGFTLVELIIVMAILAILAALAVPKFSSVLSNAKGKARLQNHEMILNAADLYVTSETNNDSGFETDLNQEIDETCPLIEKGYLKKVPKDPINNDNYHLNVDVVSGAITTGTVTE